VQPIIVCSVPPLASSWSSRAESLLDIAVTAALAYSRMSVGYAGVAAAPVGVAAAVVVVATASPRFRPPEYPFDSGPPPGLLQAASATPVTRNADRTVATRLRMAGSVET
jgi:hypothetical protein